jgi:hypothetical protein
VEPISGKSQSLEDPILPSGDSAWTRLVSGLFPRRIHHKSNRRAPIDELKRGARSIPAMPPAPMSAVIFVTPGREPPVRGVSWDYRMAYMASKPVGGEGVRLGPDRVGGAIGSSFELHARTAAAPDAEIAALIRTRYAYGSVIPDSQWWSCRPWRKAQHDGIREILFHGSAPGVRRAPAALVLPTADTTRSENARARATRLGREVRQRTSGKIISRRPALGGHRTLRHHRKVTLHSFGPTMNGWFSTGWIAGTTARHRPLNRGAHF